MASTITVQDLVDFARTHVKLIPLQNIGGFQDEPALRLANKIKKRIINRAYNWEWNRASIPAFLTVENQFEYPHYMPDIGWLERGYAEYEDSGSVPKDTHPLIIKRDLQRPWFRGEPQMVGLDINVVRVPVIRVFPFPTNIEWRLYIDYQRKPTRIDDMTCPSGSFAPIPDEMEDVLTQFFLAFAYQIAGDKQHYYSSLVDAERLLAGHAGYSSAEESNTGFVPDIQLF